MFVLATTVTIAIALMSAFFVGLSLAQYAVLFEAQYVAIAAIAFYAKPTQRDRAVISVLLLWATWVFVTDWVNIQFSPIYLNFESAAFSALTLWTLVRPYNYSSYERPFDNVAIGFYHGKNKHLLSSLGSLIGLPFSSIVIVAGGRAIRAGHGGVIREVQSLALFNGDYTFVDTGVPASRNIRGLFSSVVGKKVKYRMGCISAMAPVLNQLGYKLSWYDFVPSLFYRKALRK